MSKFYFNLLRDLFVLHVYECVTSLQAWGP